MSDETERPQSKPLNLPKGLTSLSDLKGKLDSKPVPTVEIASPSYEEQIALRTQTERGKPAGTAKPAEAPRQSGRKGRPFAAYGNTLGSKVHHLRFPEPVNRALTLAALDQGVSFNHLVEIALADYLERHGIAIG